MAKAELGSPNTRAEQSLAPPFMPRDNQRKPTGFQVYTFPTIHRQVNAGRGPQRTAGRIKIPGNGRARDCRRCTELAQRDGYKDWYHTDGRDESESNKKVWKMADGSNIPRTVMACSVCKVHLCKECFRMEDEEGNGHRDRWDHNNQCLLACAIACN